MQSSGVSGNAVNTIRRVNIKFSLNSQIVEYTFQVITYSVPIRGDGILGLDYLKKFNGNIDIKKSALEFYNAILLKLKLQTQLKYSAKYISQTQ